MLLRFGSASVRIASPGGPVGHTSPALRSWGVSRAAGEPGTPALLAGGGVMGHNSDTLCPSSMSIVIDGRAGPESRAEAA